LVILFVLGSLMALITWQSLAGRRALDRRQNEIQAVWLARAGIELAAARLLTNPTGYTGESVELIPGSQIKIEVRSEQEEPNTYVVSSEVHYSSDLPHLVIRSLTSRFRRVVDKDRARLEIVVSPAPVKSEGKDQPVKEQKP
jgi:hypothetical protein